MLLSVVVKVITADIITNITDINTMVMTLILMASKLVDIPKNADLWKNFCYETLLKSHFRMGDLL